MNLFIFDQPINFAFKHGDYVPFKGCEVDERFFRETLLPFEYWEKVGYSYNENA